MELIVTGVIAVVAIGALAYVAVRQRPSDLRIADLALVAYEQGLRIQWAKEKDCVERIVELEKQLPDRPENQRPAVGLPVDQDPDDEPVSIGTHRM